MFASRHTLMPPDPIVAALMKQPMHSVEDARAEAPLYSGFYAWCCNGDELPRGVPLVQHPEACLGLLCIGIAPDKAGSESNLRKRLRQHTKGAIGSSTFRFGLAALLFEDKRLAGSAEALGDEMSTICRPLQVPQAGKARKAVDHLPWDRADRRQARQERPLAIPGLPARIQALSNFLGRKGLEWCRLRRRRRIWRGIAFRVVRHSSNSQLVKSNGNRLAGDTRQAHQQGDNGTLRPFRLAVIALPLSGKLNICN
jgi:hypothetical protein